MLAFTSPLVTHPLHPLLPAGVYLGLMPSLAELHRPDLMLGALCCAVLCLCPVPLSRIAKEFYLRNRDYLLFFQ